jgi:hypothetical protein
MREGKNDYWESIFDYGKRYKVFRVEIAYMTAIYERLANA